MTAKTASLHIAQPARGTQRLMAISVCRGAHPHALGELCPMAMVHVSLSSGHHASQALCSWARTVSLVLLPVRMARYSMASSARVLTNRHALMVMSIEQASASVMTTKNVSLATSSITVNVCPTLFPSASPEPHSTARPVSVMSLPVSLELSLTERTAQHQKNRDVPMASSSMAGNVWLRRTPSARQGPLLTEHQRSALRSNRPSVLLARCLMASVVLCPPVIAWSSSIVLRQGRHCFVPTD